MSVTIADAVASYRTGLLNAAVTAVNDTNVLVLRGAPGPQQPDDIISIGVPSGNLGERLATYSATQRTREMVLTCDITFSIWRKGGAAIEETVTARAFDLLSKVEKQIRVDDITLGGIVRWCLCTSFGIQGTEPVAVAQGRLIEFPATFVAPVRLTN